jgi:hypothetical protein
MAGEHMVDANDVAAARGVFRQRIENALAASVAINTIIRRAEAFDFLHGSMALEVRSNEARWLSATAHSGTLDGA